MLTNIAETSHIIAISSEFLPVSQLYRLFNRLDQEVGVTTSDVVLKSLLRDLKHTTGTIILERIDAGRGIDYVHEREEVQDADAQATEVVQGRRRTAWQALWGITVVLHFLVVAANAIAFFLLPFLTSWYVALPLCTFIAVWAVVDHAGCPLTAFENYCRRLLGWRQMKGFVWYYILRPFRDHTRRRKPWRVALPPESNVVTQVVTVPEPAPVPPGEPVVG